MTHITSRQNPLVSRYRAIADGSDRTQLLLDGIHLVTEALDAGIAITDAMVALTSAQDRELAPLLARLSAAGVSVTTASTPVMAAVSPVRSSSAIVATAPRVHWTVADALARPPVLLVCAVGVQDPGNVGAIARVSEAGGATGLAVADQSADPFGWKALRGSMGSALRLPIVHPCDAMTMASTARARGCRTLAAVPRGGLRPDDVDLTGSIAVFVGGEGGGLPPDLVAAADCRVTIPMAKPVESLNTAVCAALLVYEAQRQRTRAATGATR